MSSLKDVINLQKRQLDRYNELKKDVLKKITNKISHLAKHNELRCIYTVPRYIFGFSTYKVEDITSFLFLHTIPLSSMSLVRMSNRRFSYSILQIYNFI